MENLQLRNIMPADNAALATIIRDSLKEFNAAKPGTVYFDQTTDRLSDVFATPGSKYFVATINGEIIGGAGIFPTQNLPPATCELVKLYLNSKARGKGVGKMLLAKCEETAVELGYKTVYLETMPELSIAVPLYKKMGYSYLPAALGNSGHSGCDIWMIKNL